MKTYVQPVLVALLLLCSAAVESSAEPRTGTRRSSAGLRYCKVHYRGPMTTCFKDLWWANQAMKKYQQNGDHVVMYEHNGRYCVMACIHRSVKFRSSRAAEAFAVRMRQKGFTVNVKCYPLTGPGRYPVHLPKR